MILLNFKTMLFGIKHFYKFPGKHCEFSDFTTVNRDFTEKDNFPLKQIMAGDTDGSNEELYGQLGPLMCEGGNVKTFI